MTKEGPIIYMRVMYDFLTEEGPIRYKVHSINKRNFF